MGKSSGGDFELQCNYCDGNYSGYGRKALHGCKEEADQRARNLFILPKWMNAPPVAAQDPGSDDLTAEQRQAKVREAVALLLDEKRELTGDGRPKMEAIDAAVGFKVSPQERAAAIEAYRPKAA
jgi:hypothetical protein